AAIVDNARKRWPGRFVQRDLPRGCTRRVCDRAGFAPDQFRAPCTETNVPAEGEFTWSAVEFRIAPFHRVNAPPVADRARAHCQRLKHGLKICRESKVDAEPRVLCFDFRNGLLLEEFRHGSPPASGLAGGGREPPVRRNRLLTLLSRTGDSRPPLAIRAIRR